MLKASSAFWWLSAASRLNPTAPAARSHLPYRTSGGGSCAGRGRGCSREAQDAGPRWRGGSSAEPVQVAVAAHRHHAVVERQRAELDRAPEL